MGKKSATIRNKSTSSPTIAPHETEVGSAEMLKLKEEGNRLFGRKEYQKALESYDRALKVVNVEAKEDLALLHSNKAACFMMFQRFKEAVNECTNALDAIPAYHKALVRRAKAYEQMGHFKQALSDIQKANKADTANPETQESEKRLRDIVTGKRQGGVLAVNGAAGRKLGKQRQQLFVFTAKVSFENETRVMHLANTASYAELLETVRLKFPNAWPCQIKYLDREADLVTLTEKQDLQQAMGEVMEAAERSASLPGHGTRGLPLQTLLTATPLKLQLVRCSEEEVPRPPQEEEFMLAQVNQMRRQIQAQQQAAAQKKASDAAAASTPQQPETYEIDQWILDFAQLFRESLNIEPDRHLDLTNMGWDKLQAALDTAVQSEKAPALFDAAADKFQEVSAHGMLQWGNVLFCQGKRAIDKAAAAGRDVVEVAEEAEAGFTAAEAKYRESRRIKEDFYDAYVSLGNLEFERAKLSLGLAVPPPRSTAEETAEASEEPETTEKVETAGKLSEKPDAEKPEKSEAETAAAQEATNKEQQELLKAALAKVTAEKLEGARGHFDGAWAHFQEALDKLPEEDRGKKLKPVQEGQAAEEEANPWAHCQVMWGNLLYEASQIYAAAGREDWHATLDSAVEKFRAAGCPEADIRAALGNHTQAEHLDLPPVEEPVKEKEVVEAVPSKPKATVPNGTERQAAEEDAVKGLPSLGPRPKKKAAQPPAESAQAEA